MRVQTVDLKPQPDGTLTCPECGKKGYKNSSGLGSHRQKAHGLLGTSTFARYMQRIRKERAEASSDTQNTFADSDPDPDPQPPLRPRGRPPKDLSNTVSTGALSSVSTSALTNEETTNASRPASANNDGENNEPSIVKANKTTNHNLAAGKQKQLQSNFQQLSRRTFQDQNAPGYTSEEEINSSLITYAVGRLEATCYQLALENDLPAKKFTKWVAKYFQLSANR